MRFPTKIQLIGRNGQVLQDIPFELADTPDGPTYRFIYPVTVYSGESIRTLYERTPESG